MAVRQPGAWVLLPRPLAGARWADGDQFVLAEPASPLQSAARLERCEPTAQVWRLRRGSVGLRRSAAKPQPRSTGWCHRWSCVAHRPDQQVHARGAGLREQFVNVAFAIGDVEQLGFGQSFPPPVERAQFVAPALAFLLFDGSQVPGLAQALGGVAGPALPVERAQADAFRGKPNQRMQQKTMFQITAMRTEPSGVTLARIIKKRGIAHA